MTHANSLALVILAAGIGSRFGGIKQLTPVGPRGEILLEYSLYDALRAGFNQFAFIIRPEIKRDFDALLTDRLGKSITYKFVYQTLTDLPDGYTPPKNRTKPWGTGHAVLTAANTVDVPFAVINADDYYGPTSYQILASYLRTASPRNYALVSFELEKTLSKHGTVSRGVCHIKGGYLTHIEEFTHLKKNSTCVVNAPPDQPPSYLRGNEPVSMNMWGFTPDVFPLLRYQFEKFLTEASDLNTAEFYLPSALDASIKADEITVKALSTPESWFGMTYKQDRELVRNAINSKISQGLYPTSLWQ